MHSIVFWLMGSFSLSQWSDVELVFPYIAVGIGVILLYARPLNIMQLDEEQAQQLGINVERLKLVLLAAATLITAAAVSFVGTIGFVRNYNSAYGTPDLGCRPPFPVTAFGFYRRDFPYCGRHIGADRSGTR